MPHTITYDPKTHVIETKYQGVVTFNEIVEFCSEINNIALEKRCIFTLGDYREAKVDLSTMEIFQLPKIISDILISSGMNQHKFRRAFVVARDLDDFNFFETVTLNSGQNARVFQDVDEARKWLHEK